MLKDGQLLTPRYRIVRQLKKGGMGAVYEAFDKVLKALVAIKENRLEDADMREAFMREAQLLANLRHPSLPRCIDLVSADEGQFLVMEFIEGDDLACVMTEQRAWLPNETVAEVAWQLLDVLEYLHGESVLHRDIKPANIKLKDGRAYLLDFGLAYGRSGEMETISGAEFNWQYHSKRYSPLEQSRCQRTTPASDLYSLAATLYYLLTNVQPVDAEERADRLSLGGKDPLEDVRVYNPSADEDLSRAVMQALSLVPGWRPQSARQMRELMFPEEAAPPEKTAPRGFLTARLLIEALILCVLACILFLAPRWARRPQAPAAVPRPAPRQTVRPVNGPSPAATEDKPSPAAESARLTAEGERLRHSGDDEEARDKFEQALALDRNNVSARFHFYDMLLEDSVGTASSDEHLTEVRKNADIILSLLPSPRSARECVARAWAKLVKHDFDGALADADTALTVHEANSVEALTLRASAMLLKAGKKKLDEQTAAEALTYYDRALALAPGYAQAYANRAAIHLFIAGLPRRAGDADASHLASARADYEKAIALAARAGLYEGLGNVHRALRDNDAARDNYLKAAEEDPKRYQTHVNLGDLFFEEERWGDAEKSYRRVLDIDMTPPARRKHALKRLCAVYVNLHQPDAAEKNCGLLLKLAPNDAEARQSLTRARAARAAGAEREVYKP